MLEMKSVERPLDGSAHDRVKSAALHCMTSAQPLHSRVEAAYAMLAHILGETFGPRSTELLKRLQLGDADGVVYPPNWRPIFGNVPRPILKQWLEDLFQLYSWSCFLTGGEPELAFVFDDDALLEPKRAERRARAQAKLRRPRVLFTAQAV
jgi:hypothetical protein